jgi:F-type H+-transporting ATPase subunit epsilon
MLPEAIELQVVTPERHVVAENVQSVQLPGKEGELGVLPGHAPLITELGIGVMSYRKDGAARYLSVVQGYAEVLPDRVIVLAEIAERAEEIDVPRAQQAKDRAQAAMGKTPSGDAEWKTAAFALERSLVRLRTATHSGGGSGDSSH